MIGYILTCKENHLYSLTCRSFALSFHKMAALGHTTKRENLSFFFDMSLFCTIFAVQICVKTHKYIPKRCYLNENII